LNNKTKYNSPIFIGGTGRSGTSVLGKLLSEHPDIIYFGESRFLIDGGGVYDAINDYVGKDIFEKKILCTLRSRMIESLRHQGYNTRNLFIEKKVKRIFDTCFVSPEISEDCASIFVRCMYEYGMGNFRGNVLLEKTPHTNIMADFLYRTFPNIRYMHIIRDPRDVYCSMLCQTWGPNNLKGFINYYNDNMIKAWNSYVDVPRSNYMIYSIERIVNNPTLYIRRILNFTGLSYTPKTLTKYIRHISKKRAHVCRWKEQLDAEDADTIMKKCGGAYKRWINIETNQYSKKKEVKERSKVPRRPRSNNSKQRG